jgi:hypothetical protein
MLNRKTSNGFVGWGLTVKMNSNDQQKTRLVSHI